MRRQEEFYCSIVGGGCGKYFLTFLRENMYGNYTIYCPNCSHTHFRIIREGIVTEDRHHDRLGDAEIIVGLKATLKDTPYHDDPKYRRSLIRNVVNN